MLNIKGKFGLERETLRVDSNGRLAATEHPFKDPALSRDFCENQLEIITPVCDSIDEAVACLGKLSEQAEKTLSQMGESLWMNSNPPYFEDESEIPIALYDGDQIEKHHYRVKLERRYGKKLMLYSGIHFNLSYGETVDNQFYMKLLKYATKYSWLITLLTAASPVYDASLDGAKEKKRAFAGYASMRNSKRGYWNQFVPVLDYSSLEAYCQSVQEYIDKGALFSAGELYMPVRVKCSGANDLQRLVEKGIDHIELRMFDLNPLEPLGINQKDLEFAYVFMAYLSEQKDFDFDEKMQLAAVGNQKNAAKYDLSNIQIDGVNIIDKAKRLLNDIIDYYKNNQEVSDLIEYQLQKLNEGHRYAELIYNKQ